MSACRSPVGQPIPKDKIVGHTENFNNDIMPRITLMVAAATSTDTVYKKNVLFPPKILAFQQRGEQK